MAIKSLNQRGYTIIELLIAVGIMAAMASAVVAARSYMARQTQKTGDKIFATEKAIQMFEELRALANQGGQSGLLTLDNYSDGSNYNDILTTDKNVTAPSDSLSANKNIGYWKFWRQVSVLHLAQDPFARIVNVKVFGGLVGNTADTGTLLAEVGGILRISSSIIPPTQVYDIYELALSNELGWFTQVPNMTTAFSQAVGAVTVLNPGLIIRPHQITQTAFGRDFFYNPYINSSTDPTSGAAVANNDTIQIVMPWIYFYPGNTPQTSGANSGTDTMFFSDSQLRQVGGINVNNTILNDNGYSMCDMYNTAMRYPDEVAAYNAVSLATAANPSAPTYQMTLRMLLETMNSQPSSFLNPMLISMHGEVLPLVNMRNYSDAAKDPLNASLAGGNNIRVVTHPTLIHYPMGMAATLRVYAYYDGLLDPSTLDTAYAMTNRASTITLYFPSLKLLTSDIGVSAIVGGVNAGTTVRYNAVSLSSGTASMGMSWSMGNPNTTDTAITLFNTPLRCESVTITGAGGSTTGLLPGARLYGAEYIPCPVDNNLNYNTDLTQPSTIGPLNTARWVISINKQSGVTIPTGQYAVETRLGTDLTTGNYPPAAGSKYVTLMSDLSRTYLWIGTGNNNGVTWGGSGVTPFTERYQYNGDPRHSPYLDCKFGNSVTGTNSYDTGTTIDYGSYNWYWEQIGTGAYPGGDGYLGFGKSTNGFQANPTGTATFGDVRDMPRYYYTYRRGIMQTTGIFTNLNGWTCWHASEGGELGGTYDPFASSLKYIDTPWNPTNTSLAAVQNIDEVQESNNWNPGTIPVTAANSTARDVVFYNSSTPLDANHVWYAKWWEGEMYPDSINGAINYPATWVAYGNMPTSQFWRVPFEAITATGNNVGLDLGRHIQWGVGSEAPAAFLNGVSSAGTSYSLAVDGGGGFGNQSDITALGLNLYNITNFVMSSPVSANNTRPWNCYFDLSQDSSKLPPNWGDSYYQGLRTTLSVPKVPSSINANNYSRIIYTSEDSTETGDLHSAAATWNTLGVIEADYTAPAAGSTQTTGYFNLSGLAPQGTSGPQILAQTGINTMIRTYLDGGVLHNSGAAGHIPQLPLFQVSTGNAANQFAQPSAVTISWSSPVSGASLWTRWAGFAGGANWYTEEYPSYSIGSAVTNSTYTEPVTMFYVPMWSSDGVNWISMIDNTTALTPGNYYVSAGLTTAQQAVTWNVSSTTTFPQNLYSVRVDGFRQGYPLHYSYHEVQNISITR